MENIKEGYTRVSTILGQWNSFAHINPDVLANKCRIGTNVHAKIAAECEGIFIDLEPDEEGYFESWERWWEKEELSSKLLKTEQRFYCDDLMITGCVDALVAVDSHLIIVDYKTSASANKKMWALQAAFYHYLVKSPYTNLKNEVWFPRLKKEGKKATHYKFEITDELWETCLSALKTYRYFNA